MSALVEAALARDPYDVRAYLAAAHVAARAGDVEQARTAVEQARRLGAGPRALALADAQLGIAEAIADGRGEAADRAIDRLAPFALPDDADVALALLEAVVHATSKRMREQLVGALDAIRPRVAHTRRIVRLAHLATFTLAVGGTLDDRNAPVLDAIVRLADRVRAIDPADPGPATLLAIAQAKRLAAPELCARIAELAKGIPDVRILRMLLRERLATVTNPDERRALFEIAMAKIPGLDGIAHDFLQMVHLVAKRAMALGSAAEAIASWKHCLERDPDNLGALENWCRVVERIDPGSAELVSALPRRAELRAIYARYSPRADLVLARVVATLEDELATRLDGAAELELSALAALGRERARITALAILAEYPALRDSIDATAWRALFDAGLASEAVFRHARAIVAQRPEARAAHALTLETLLPLVANHRTKDYERREPVVDVVRTGAPGSLATQFAAAFVDAACGPSLVAVETQLGARAIEAAADTLATFAANVPAGIDHRLFGLQAITTLRDPRVPLDEALVAARGQARRSVASTDSEVAMLAGSDDQACRELLGVRRAEILLSRKDPVAALVVLAWVYRFPFTVTNLAIPVRAWAYFPAAGTGGYQLTVATAMRDSMIKWETSPHDLFAPRTAIRADIIAASEIAVKWASLARQVFGSHNDHEHAGQASAIEAELAAHGARAREANTKKPVKRS